MYTFNIQTVIHVYVCILVNGNNSVHTCSLILCDVIYYLLTVLTAYLFMILVRMCCE